MSKFDDALKVSLGFNSGNRIYATPEEYKILHDILKTDQPDIPCPYCKQTKCVHWTGMGWTKEPKQ